MNINNETVDALNNPLPVESPFEEQSEEPLADSLPIDDQSELSREGKHQSVQFAQFQEEFDKRPSPEDKIRLSIEFMRETLTHQGPPRFRDFWEGRKLCLPLFKEGLQPKTRAQLWGEYIELSGEARRLKEILDEQSAFAIEQIELAIQGIERDIEHYSVLLSHLEEFLFPQECISLKQKHETYSRFQRELQLLNTLASRINELRKEVIKTEMRVRAKNKLFRRLSLCGDQVFPRRKELIKAVSEEFGQDIEHFVASYFNESAQHAIPLYALREEIKALQVIAKLLTLNTYCFTQTRLKLSQCWDQLKNLDKERKKEIASKKQTFKENFDLVKEKIDTFSQICKGDLTLDEANRQANEITALMRNVELGREEVKALKEEIALAKNPIFERVREEENRRLQKEREVESDRREKIDTLKDALDQLLSVSEEVSAEEVMEKRDQLSQDFDILRLNKTEKQIIERQFKQLKDFICERKGRALMALSEDDLKSLQLFQGVLDEQKERRSEIKNQLEIYRKALGGSGFDFEKAMMYRELIEAERATLDKINASISEIEEKIAEIEG